jgi:hypothetical protein
MTHNARVEPQIRYAKAGDGVSIAYFAMGTVPGSPPGDVEETCLYDTGVPPSGSVSQC